MSLEFRTSAFSRWCDRYSLQLGHFYSASPDTIIAILGLFLEDVADGDNIKGLLDLSDSTLCNYLNAAAAWLESHCPGLSIPL